MNIDSCMQRQCRNSSSKVSSRATTFPSALATTVSGVRLPVYVRLGDLKKLSTNRYVIPESVENTTGISTGRINSHAGMLSTKKHQQQYNKDV